MQTAKSKVGTETKKQIFQRRTWGWWRWRRSICKGERDVPFPEICASPWYSNPGTQCSKVADHISPSTEHALCSFLSCPVAFWGSDCGDFSVYTSQRAQLELTQETGKANNLSPLSLLKCLDETFIVKLKLYLSHRVIPCLCIWK